MPLLHPAHTLKQGKLSGAVGASGNFLLGDASTAIDSADAAAAGSPLGEQEGEDTAAGLSASLLGAPGLAPFVAARVGIAERTEAGLAYTGRSARIDARHALEDKTRAASGGLGFRVLLTHPTNAPNGGVETSGAIAGIDSGGVKGFGVDLPLLVGYRSDADLVQLWGGVRGGYQRVFGEVLFAQPNTPSAELDATALSVDGLLGLGIGLSPIWVAAELSLGYLHVDGTLEPEGLNSTRGTADGITVTPAGAIIGRF